MTMTILAIVSHVFHSRMYFKNKACDHPVGGKLGIINVSSEAEQHADADCFDKSLDDLRERATDIADVVALGARPSCPFRVGSNRIDNYEFCTRTSASATIYNTGLCSSKGHLNLFL